MRLLPTPDDLRSLSLEAAVGAYIGGCRFRNLSRSTLVSYESTLRPFARFARR